MKKKIGLIVACLIAVGFLGKCFGISTYKSILLSHWKRTAIPTIDSFCSDSNAIANEVAQLKASAIKDEQKWFSSRLIPFKNGEWVAYAQKSCNKDWRFPDFVIAKGSDGAWCYTTMHFCPGMFELLMDGQPKSLKGFKKRYFFRNFSGDPSEKMPPTAPKTWSWGSEDEANL
jgi:hypothetical protein